MDEDSRQRADLAIERTLTASALAGERVVSIIRLLFCTVIGVRSAWMWSSTTLAQGHEAERAWITFPALAVTIAFSIAILAGVGRRRTALMLHVSVAVDAVVCFLVLLPNALWPAAEYRGAPYMIDTAVLLILAVSAGLRHSATAAILGGLLNGTSYAALAVVDGAVTETLDPAIEAAHLMYGVLLGAAGGLALVIATRTRRLVERGARTALVAEQAERGLRSLLRGHHDLRSVISSAQINAELLARRGEVAPDRAAQLRADLDELRRQLDLVKGRAIEELAGLDERTPVEIAEATEHVASALRPRFPGVTLEVLATDVPPALVAGGPPALRRILANLVVNACEGDGARRAARVQIAARREQERIAIEILDDGPGLPAHVLAAAPGEAVSTKPVGTGLGIGLVDGLVRASGGTVSWLNRDGGGACVLIELPPAG